MAFTHAQLAAEINQDPKALGYAALVASHDRAGLVAKLNASYAGVGTIWRNDLAPGEIVGALVATEVATYSVTQWTAFQSLLIPPTIDASQATIRNLFATLFPNASAPQTLANLTTVAKSALSSRAEELWGYGTRVTEQDIADSGVGGVD